MLAFSPEVGMALLRLFPPDVVLLHSELAEKLELQIHQACPATPVVLTGEEPVSVEELQWLTKEQHASRQAQQARRLPH
jgi:hypothetical protein